MVITTEKLREMNRELIRKYLRKNRNGDKSSISRHTGLSISTCRIILNEMLLTGEIKEDELLSSNGGRPSVNYKYNEDYAYIGVIALSRIADTIHLYASVNNLFCHSLYKIEEEYKHLGYRELSEIIDKMQSEYPRLEVISIGIPGIVTRGYIDTADVEDIAGIDLGKKLTEDFKLKFVIENDLNAAALGYYTQQMSGEAESFVYLYFPELGNPGAGIVINGKVITGRTNFAGEVGYLPSAPPFEHQGGLQKDEKSFFEFIKEIILSVNSVINPEKIIISWFRMDKEVKKRLNNQFSDYRFKHHLPEISYNDDINVDYIGGLAYLGMKELSCKIGVTEA